MKKKIRDDINDRYENPRLQILLYLATYFDPRFKTSFVAMEKEVKNELLTSVIASDFYRGQHGAEHDQESKNPQAHKCNHRKRKKTDLKS